MKKALILFTIPLFLFAGNVAAVDLSGTWEAVSECYGVNAGDGDDPEDPTIERGTSLVEFHKEDGDFIWTKGEEVIINSSSYHEYCYGVIDGNKISMTCAESEANGYVGSFGYGEIKGKTIKYISHVPMDGKTCKITVTPYVEAPEK